VWYNVLWRREIMPYVLVTTQIRLVGLVDVLLWKLVLRKCVTIPLLHWRTKYEVF
jgi:hypothetical protein